MLAPTDTEDNSVDSGASVRGLLLNKRSIFSIFICMCRVRRATGSRAICPPTNSPLFLICFFFFAGQMIILVQSTGPVSQLVSRVSELLH